MLIRFASYLVRIPTPSRFRASFIHVHVTEAGIEPANVRRLPRLLLRELRPTQLTSYLGSVESYAVTESGSETLSLV